MFSCSLWGSPSPNTPLHFQILLNIHMPNLCHLSAMFSGFAFRQVVLFQSVVQPGMTCWSAFHISDSDTAQGCINLTPSWMWHRGCSPADPLLHSKMKSLLPTKKTKGPYIMICLELSNLQNKIFCKLNFSHQLTGKEKKNKERLHPLCTWIHHLVHPLSKWQIFKFITLSPWPVTHVPLSKNYLQLWECSSFLSPPSDCGHPSVTKAWASHWDA